jgi:hypothetical protein
VIRTRMVAGHRRFELVDPTAGHDVVVAATHASYIRA